VLSDEDGMAAVRRLAAVLVRLRRSDAPGEEILRLRSHRAHAAQLDERAVATAQMERRAERMAAYAIDAFVDAHRA
jgi:hypothetical protein